MPRAKRGDRERFLWIDNDAGLYRWWKSTALSRAQFVRRNKATIDGYIDRRIAGKPKESQ